MTRPPRHHISLSSSLAGIATSSIRPARLSCGAWSSEGYAAETVECFEVPGAFEIPLRAQLLAKSGRYDAIVAAGFVVDGGIYRHEFVAASVIDALMRVQLDTEVPVLSLVLTPQQFHEHETHRTFFRDHFLIKGEEAAVACAATLVATRRLKESAADVREARAALSRN